MTKQYKVLVNTGKAETNQTLDVQQFAGDKGQPVRIKAQAGAKYELQELGRKKPVGPDYVKAKRVGKDLHILFADETEASLILEDYYEVMPEGYNGVIGQAENGLFYEYIPEDPRVPGLIPELAEGGRAVNVALGGAEVIPVGAALGVLAFNPLLAALGLAGAAGAAALINANDSVAAPTPITGKLSSQSDNIDGGDDNDNKTRDNTPTLTGTAPAGSTVLVSLNGVDYPVAVNPDGTWTFQQPSGLPDGTYYPVLKVTQNGVTTSQDLTPFTIDTVAPAVAITSAAAALAPGQTTTLTFTLSEATNDFTAEDVAVTGGTLSNFQRDPLDPLKYTATFTPSAEGTSATVRVASDKFSDAAGNMNTDGAEADNNLSFATNAAVTGALQPTAPNDSGKLGDNITNDNTPAMSGKVPAGSTAKIVINGVEQPVTVAPDGSWTYTQPTGLPDGTYTPQLIVTPSGSNTPGAPVPLTPFTIDTVAPTMAVVADTNALASGQTAAITFTLSEPVADFSASDVTVTGGALSGFQQSATNPKIWTAVFTPAASGTSATISVPSGKFSDAAGNANTDGADANNTVTLATNAATNGSLSPSSDNATGIPNDNKTNDNTPEISGKVPAGSTAKIVIDGKTYPVNVGPDGSWTYTQPDGLPDGTYTPELIVTPSGSNTPGAPVPMTPFTIDTKPPVVAITGSTDSLSAGQSTVLTFTLSEASTDLTDADIQVSGGKLGTLQQSASNPLVYTAVFTAAAGSTSASVQIGNYKFSDAAGNLNADGADANNTWGTTVTPVTPVDPVNPPDTTPPTIAVDRLGSGTLTSSETIRFTLSEASTQFSQGDVTVTGGTLSNFTPVPTSGTAGTGYTVYTATFTPSANSTGTATIGVAAGKFSDNAGNQNLDTFIGATGAVTGQVVESNNQVSLPYNTQANPNPPADTTAPSVIVARAGSGNLASGNTELITFTLSEGSTSFNASDVDVSGGTLSGFAPVPGSGNATSGYHQYTAVFTPAANSVGTATIGVAAGKFQDAAGNANTDTYVAGAGFEANNLVSMGYNTQQSDTTKPTIEVSRAGSGTVTASETVYFTLSEASTSFALSDIDVTGGTLSNFAPVVTSGNSAGGYTQYTASFTPSANASGNATIGVKSSAFSDAAGNANADTYVSPAPAGATQEDNNQVVLAYNTRTNPATPDTTAPTIAITADKATLAAGQTAQLSFVLSEPSSDFVQSDVQASGGTLSNWVQVSPTQYTATFTPAAGSQGVGSVNVASNAFRDAALNANADGADANNTVNFITNYGNNQADTTAPTIVVARMGSGTLTSAETLTFTLSEASTTFGQGDIDVVGGSLSNFTPVPTSGTAGTGYTQYTATFTPSANSTGTATIGVAAGKFADNAGNANQDDYRLSGAENTNNQVSITYNTQASPNPPADTAAPTIVVARATSSSLATGNTELITFTLSENASNFTLADIDVSGGTLSALAPVPSSGTAATGYHQYMAVFTPAANSLGTATIGVAAGKFTDAAGNANQDDYRLSGAENLNNQVVIAYNTRIADTTAPTIEVSRAGSGTVTASETIYFTLSEASTTFGPGDMDVTGGTLSNFTPVPSSGTASAGYTQYTATFTPSAGSSGTATIGVKSGMFSDAAGNANADTYVAGAGFEANNLVSLNYNTSTNPATPDTTAPTIAISADKATLAAGQSASVTFVLSEPSSDFLSTDVQVSGGTLSGWTQLNPSTYSATFTPAAGGQGTGRIYVASSAFRDAAGNANADGADANNAVDFITNYGNNGGDSTPPTIVVARMGQGTLTSSETLTFTLSEASTNFAATDIDVVGGSLSNFSPVPTSGTAGTGYTQYTATFTPSANGTGTATIGVAAGKFSDNAGNANQDDYKLTGAENTNNQVSIAYNTQANPNPPADTTAPSVIVARAGSGKLASGGTETITFTLSENASTFALEDIDVVGGTLSGFAPVASSGSAASGYHQYTATFTPNAGASGTATIGVASGKFTDAKGNANTDTYVVGSGYEANNLVTIGYNTTQADSTPPTIEVSRAGSGTVGATGETVYFTLSEASSTFTLADIDVTGGTVTNLVPVASSASGTGYKQYAATFTPAANANGTATIGVASGKFTDLSGNANLDTYVSPAPAGATLEANNQISLSYNTSTNPTTPDTTAPSVAVTLDKSSLSAGQTATVTFTLSESSTTFSQSDVDVTGGTLSNWTQVSVSVYSASFTPTANTAGTATIGVKSGTFADAAGNLNQDTYVSPAPAGAVLETNNQVSLTYNAIPADTTAPTIIVARTNAGTTLANGANETITFTLSEASMDFDLSDVVITGGTLGAFTPVPTSGTPGTGYTQYTASFTPAAGSSGTATVGVAAGKFSDNAGNKNADTYVSGTGYEADNQVTLAYNTVPPDTTAPKIALSRQGSGSLTAGGSDEITFVLSEASTTFSMADVDVVGGTLTNFAPVLSSGSASTGYTDYTATFTPSSNSAGLARIGVQSGKFTDASNNANLDTYVTGVSGTSVEANNVIDITYNTQLPDTTAPTIVVSRAGAGMVSTSETIFFTLSEASTTFTQSDIDVQGGSLSGFAPVASSGNATNGYTQYAAVFTPTANSSGTASVGVKSATFADMAGNNNADTYVSPAPTGATFETNNQVSLNFNTLVPDTTAPTIAIDRSGTGVVTSTETITFTLSEPSTNFIASDIDVSGGSLSGFAPVLTSGNASTGYTQYTATFTPTAGVVGSASVAVASGKFTDAASNTNLDTYKSGVTGTTQEANNIVEFSVNTDTTAPTVAIARASGATTQTFTGAETINITLSEASRDFADTDLVATGGSLSGFAPVLASGSAATGYTQYTVTFTPTANASGNATISVASSTFSDAGGNTNRDTGTNPAPTGATFEANNLISAPFNTDTTAPTVIVTRTSGATSTVTGTESITFTFSEAINPASFDASDIDAVGGAMGNLQPDPSSGSAATGYTRYTATYTPTSGTSGSGSVGIKNAKFSDMSGNQNLDTYVSPAPTGASTQADNQVAFQVNTSAPDTTAPTIAITRAGAGTVTGTEVIYFTLSEASTTFTSGDIDVSGGSLSGFAQSSTNPLLYSATFTPTPNATGNATIGVAAGKFQDAAGNQNLDTYSGAPTAVTGQVVETNNQITLAYNTDTTAPTIVVGRQGSGTVTGPITVTFTLSEASADFSLADIDTVGGTLSNLQGSGTSYTATFTPTANAVGTASVGVASSKFSDAGGNFNKDTYLANVAGATEEGVNSVGPNIVVFQFSTDTSAPTIALSRSGTTGATFTAPETITFTLSETSSDFTWNGTSGDIAVSGGTLSALTQSSANPLIYTATFTPNANASGTASISVASSKFSDSAGNLNADGADANNLITAPFNTVPADTTPPTVAVTRANGNTTQSFTGAESIVFTFSEAVASTSFTSTDIDAVGGVISGLQPDSSSGSASTGYTRYTATFTPNTAGTVSIGVDASRFADAAGNSNIDTYRSAVSGTTQEANNQVSATYVPPATNATATIDILGMTTDAGTSATDFKTNDQSLAFNGSITNWVSTDGDRVMLEVYDADPTSGTFGQILTSGFTAPATDGTWSWTDSNTNRAAGLYTLKATIVSANGTTPVNTTAPTTVSGNQTNGGWDNQVFSIDTGANNTDINLGLRITTDTSNDGNVTTAELAGATSFTSRATFNSSAKAGDKLTFTATNDGVALNAVTVTLTPADITNGYVDTTFAIPADSKTQIVKVNYTDLAGNVATDTQPQDSATLQLANNTTATIDVTSVVDAATSSSDTGTSATDFVTSDQTLSYKGTITGWVSTNGDRVMLQLFDSSNNQIGSNAFVTPAADGSWTWNDTTNTRAAGTYSLKATIVSANGITALNSTAPVNGTGGGYDQQVVVIDTAAANSDITLAVQISTDADNNAFVNTSEIGSSTTFTTRATFSNSTAKAGDKITFNASNDGTALTPVTVTLTPTDVTNGYVETTFAKPAEGKVQLVTASYTDLAGNAAAGTVSDSATLDTTTPTIVVNRSGTGTMIGAETITFTLSEASTDFVWDHLTQTGDIVVTGGSLGQLTTTNNITYTATFTPTANTTGTASVGVQASAFKDAAGNNNADDYRSTGAENTNNQISTSFNTVLPTATITQINGDGAPTAPPTLTITDSTTAGAAITGYAAASVTGTPSVVRYKFDFSTSVSDFALTDISFMDSATGAAIASGNVGTLQGSGSSYYVDVTMPTGSGSVAAIVRDGSYNDASDALLAGTGSSFVQAYSGTGGSFGTSTVTSAGNLTTPIALTLSNGNVVSYYYNNDVPNPGAFVLFNSSGQVIKSLTNLPNSGGTIKGGERQGNVFETQNGGFGFLSRIAGTTTEQLVTYDSTGTLVSGPTTLTGIGLGDDFPATTTSDGHLAIAYPGTDFSTHVRKVSLTSGANFGTQMTDTIVAGTGSSPATSAPAELVRLSNGDLGFVWNPLVNGGPSNQSFSYRILNSDGSIKSATVGSINISSLPAMQISGDTALYLGTDSTSMGSMKAIATSDGGMAIVFEVNSNDATPRSELALVRIDASGARTTTTIFGETDLYNVGLQPDMTQLPSGQLMVLWNDKGANQFQSKYQIVNSDGTLSGSATTLSSLTYGGDSDRFNSTAIANLAGGKVLAIQNGNYVVLSPADGTQTITGTTGDNTQMGGAGADTLTGGGGADIILAGEGNDTVVINASNISNLTTAGKLLDGGAGVDTLRIGADTSTLDLSKSTVQANVQNFEKIDLGSDTVVNTVILNAAAVQRLATQNLDGSTSNKQLIIDGTSSDLVKLSGQYNNGILAGYWQQSSTTPTRTIGGVTYKVYTISGLSGVEVLVNNAITSANTDVAYQMASGDIVTLPNTSVTIGDLEATATGGSTGSGDGGSQQPLATSSTTSDVTPLVQGTLSQALSGNQVLKLYRTNVTDSGSAVEVSANVTTSGTSWQYQDSGLTAGKQYRYEAKIYDGSTVVDASNTYTINQAVSALPTATITQINGDGAPLAPPTLTITDSTTGTAAHASTITFTFTFDQAVNGFTAQDVTLHDSNGAVLTLTPTGTWADGQTVFTGTVAAPASGNGSVAVVVNDGSYSAANNAQLLGKGSSHIQDYSSAVNGFEQGTATNFGTLDAYLISETLSNGNYVLGHTWASGSNTGNSLAVYSSTGVLFGAVSPPSTYAATTRDGGVPYSRTLGSNFVSIEPLPGGGFVAAFFEEGVESNGVTTTAGKIYLATYNNSGQMTTPSVQADTAVITNVEEGTFDGNVAVTYNTTGNYVVAYQADGGGFYTREFTPAGVLVTGPTLVSTSTTDASVSRGGIDIAHLSNGNLVVTWSQENSPIGTYARVLNPDGTTLSSVIAAVSSATVPGQVQVEPTNDGGFVVVSGYYPGANNLSNGTIKAVKYAADGTTITSRSISTTAGANVDNPRVTELADGRLVFVWTYDSVTGGDKPDVRMQLLAADFTPIGSEQILFESTLDVDFSSGAVTVTDLAGGGFVVHAGQTYVGPTTAASKQIFFNAVGAPISTTGTTGNNTQIGGAGADTLTGGGGADIILAGEGNDTVVINASNISNLTTAGKLLDGGAGVDTLRISADTSTLDLSKSTVQANVQNFEKIDLGSDAVANTVILNATAVQRLATQNLDGSTSNKQLIIDGTSSDLVKLSDQYNDGSLAGYWQQSASTPTRVIGGVTYKVYTIGGLPGVEVLVNSAITNANTDLAYQMTSGDLVASITNSLTIGDAETGATGGSSGSGDGGSQQPFATSSSTIDTSPLVEGSLNQALTGSQVLKLFRTNVTDSGAAVEVSDNVTTSGTSWQYQESGMLASGKQYQYEARIMDGTTVVDGSNTYSITIAASSANDQVVFDAADVTALGQAGGATFDGGAGLNLIRLDLATASNITLDLTNATVDSKIDNFQKFDITGSGANTIKLNVSDVLSSNMTAAMAGVTGNTTATKAIQIDGGADDVVNLSNLLDSGSSGGTWSTSSTATIGNTTYNLYSLSNDPTVQVLIDSQITQVTLS